MIQQSKTTEDNSSYLTVTGKHLLLKEERVAETTLSLLHRI
jgi:hypothetical protein